MTAAPAGWYPDPGVSGEDRFWDGIRWTDRTRPPRLASDWRRWLARSARAVTVGRLVVALAGAGATAALVVGLTALVRAKPTQGIAPLLALAAPVLFLGQIWLIALARARMPPGKGWRVQSRTNNVATRGARTLFFGLLPWRFVGPLLILACLGWLSAVTAFPSIAHGGPTDPARSCQYRLDSHGSTTCVSRETYEKAGAGEQRFAAGILLAFFSMHLGGALGGLAERRAANRA